MRNNVEVVRDTAVSVDVPIRLGIQSPELFRQLSPSIVRVVHERDDFTCRCCGLRTINYQQAVISGRNWRDLHAITTACIFCQQCFSLDAIALMRSGVMISFSGLTQAELNRLMVEIYMARITAGRDQKARACLDMLLSTREAARIELGTDDPGEVALMLKHGDAGTDAVEVRRKLQRIRLLPLDRRILTADPSDAEFNAFPQILAYWRSSSGLWPEGKRGPLPRMEAFSQTYL